MDYQSNSKHPKKAEASADKVKNVERIILTPVIVKKKSLGRKFRDLFIEADARTVAVSVAMGVLVPAAKNMLLDAVNKGSEILIYGETASRRRGMGQGPRITYNSPVNRRGFSDSPLQYAPPQRPGAGTAHVGRLASTDLILTTREEADSVLENMTNIVDQYQVASVADLNEIVGLPTNPIDNKWGWSNLSGATVRQIREGYLLDLPPAEPIQ